jgi:hypothetical protein
MYNVGEKIVNRESHKTGIIIESKDSNRFIQYDDGSKEWVTESVISKLLLEVDPASDSVFLQD